MNATPFLLSISTVAVLFAIFLSLQSIKQILLEAVSILRELRK